ncbi:ABC transporter ATP-binding protein/permease [Dongia sp.]|uniref:ABC transporter ATP-binding protein/permease n=1 Tax=Dongia sp. TaxID=1977262 RepID=UPI0035B3E5BD
MSWWAAIRHFWRVAGGYWWAEHRWLARFLVLALIALTVAQISIPVAINLWILDLFNALESRAMDRLSFLLIFLLLIVVANVVIVNLHLRVKRQLQIGWREWLTEKITNEWMVAGRPYLLTFVPGAHDNPDGRIAEDVHNATEYAIDLSHSLLYDVLLLISFTRILWSLSEPPYYLIDDVQIHLPGYLIWIAIVYAAIGTICALTLGRFLVRSVDRRQTAEADFRFGLVHARENALRIALAKGEANERDNFRRLFSGVHVAWDGVTAALARMFYFSSSWSVLSQVFPTLIMAPRYMLGLITLGALMQTAQAFQQTVAALSWAIDNLGKFADWRASVERMMGLHDGIVALGHGREGGIEIVASNRAALTLHNVSISNAAGDAELAAVNAEIRPGDHLLVTGETGPAANIMKAVAGLWPWGTGRVEIPAGAEIYFMPSRPYMPADRLRNVLCYPLPPSARDEAAIVAALRQVGLDHLIDRLEEVAKWDQSLTADAQQRLGFARLLLQRPSWIFLEDATEALDVTGQREMVQLLNREFSHAAIVAIGHRDTLSGFGTRAVSVVRDAGGLILKDLSPPR